MVKIDRKKKTLMKFLKELGNAGVVNYREFQIIKKRIKNKPY